MPSTFFFIAGTFLLAFNFIRPFGLAVSDWLYFVALVMAFFETSTVERPKFSCWTNNKFLWPAWLILFGSVLSMFHSKLIPTAIIEIIQQIYVLTLFISLISIMVRRGKTGVILNAFIASGLITASIALSDYFLGTNYGPILSGTPDIQFWGRYAGTLGHPNKFGYFLAITATLSLARLFDSLSNKSKRRWLFAWIVVVILQVSGLYLSGSLMAYLGIMFAGLILLSSSKIFTRRAVILIYISLLACVSFLYARDTLGISISMDGMSAIRQIAATTIERVQTITAESRLLIYDQAISYIIKSPIIGAGSDQNSASGIASVRRSLSGTIHNFFLQTWYTGGLLSLIGWCAVMFSTGWISLKVLWLDHSEK